jgi:Arc/MetJ-type ribon-helix-helix transcriptional regulator
MMKPKINGFQDGGTAIEPTTGNDVPIGSLPNEVADDIDAKLSEGEFVLPADVVRYIGLERLMKLRDDAKKGLQRMAEIGQMGNAEEVGAMSNSTFEDEDEDKEDTGQFEIDIDDILAEDDGVEAQTERMMAAGGLAFKGGYDISKAPKNPVFDVRYLKHKDGRVMYITYINGKPLTPIPEGFTETSKEEAVKMASAADEAKKAAEAAKTPAQEAGAVSGQDGPGVDSGGPSGPTVTGTGPGGTITAADLATGSTVTAGQVKGFGVGASLVTGIPFGLATNPFAGKIAASLTNFSGEQAGKANVNAVADELGLDPNNPNDLSLIQAHIDSLGSQITPTSVGSTGMAMAAGADAANAAASANLSPAAQAAASQSAVNAVLSGTDPGTAVNNAVIDAAAADAAASGGGGGMGPSVGDSVTGVSAGDGVGVYARGGLVNKRKPKAKRGKGLVTQK